MSAYAPDPEQPSPLDTCAMQALRAASRTVTQRYEAALAPEDLTASQFSTLLAVSETPGIAVTRLASRLGMDRTTMPRVLRPLLDRGLVRIGTAEHDARAKSVFLSGLGEASLARALPLWSAAQDELKAELGEEGWTSLMTALALFKE